MSLQTTIRDNAHSITIPKPFELFLVRHGRSLGQDDPSAYARVGDHELPLTEKGRHQATEAGHVLNHYALATRQEPLTIYASTAVRTLQTAQNIFNAAGGVFARIVPDSRLDKQTFGLFDGLLSSAERREKFPDEYAAYKEEHARVGEFYARPPQGESIADLVDKAGAFLRDIVAEGKPAIVVTHGLNALCLEKVALGHSAQWVLDRADTVPNCNIQHVKSTGLGDAFSATIHPADPAVTTAPHANTRGTGPAIARHAAFL